MLFIFRLCNNAHGNEVWDKTWLGSEEKSIEHYENYESMFRPLVLDIFFLGWGIWLPSDKNIAPVLFDYNWLSAEWCNSLAKSYFFSLFECIFCVCFIWLASDDTRWINAIFLSFQVPLFSLWIHSSFQYLFSPSLLLSLFSTSRRVLLYSFVILIDCINLLSIEFPVHHAEHNVEYYHNPSK